MLRARVLSRSQWRGNSSSFRVFRLVLVAISILAVSVMPRQVSTAQAGWNWYRVDTHTHSSFSADTYVDLGILSHEAQSAGYSALFVSDHNLASNFPAHGVANNKPFEDTYIHWNKGTYGNPSPTLNALASSPVNTGTKSLHLLSTSSGSAETHTWAIRGPNFRSGEITLKFSVYPTQITAGSGAYVSVSIGGDARVVSPPAPSGGPTGYTTQAGVVSPGKSTLLVWQLGSARAASSDPNARVITYPLSYTLNTWNHYTINVSSALLDIPAADRPIDHAALTYIKMAAASNNGTVDVYFDSFLLKAASPVAPADEFIYRNSILGSYNTSTFKMFPSIELGDSEHVNRFDFNISNASQFVAYPDGVDGILATQQGGYPAQLNHPGSDGGVTDEQAVTNQAYGADFMEVPRNEFSIADWDAILNQGVQVIGSGSTDKHTASYGSSSTSTYIYAPALEFDALLRSFFEGRAFMSSGFAWGVNLNIQSDLQEPYPARYPIYVPSTLGAIDVHLGVPVGISSSYKVYWFRNGEEFAVDTVSGRSYDVVKSIPLDGASTYVRAELRLVSNGETRAMTQPIFFKDVPNLPADKRYHVNGVTTANGRGYTRVITKGITASGWNTASQTLSLTLENATGSLVDLRVFTATSPQQIQVNGAVISPANSLTAFNAATNSSWFYDAVSKLLYLKVKHVSGTANVTLNFSSAPPVDSGVKVAIGGTQQANYALNVGDAMRVSYAGVNNGVIKMTSATAAPIVGSESVVYKINNAVTSFSEIMGLPNSQLDTTYWLPWYNNVDLDTQLRFGNVSNANATVRVYIGGAEMPGSPFTLAPGASTRKSFAGINNGPVKVVSDQKIVAAERVIYKVNGTSTSYSEMMALPNARLDTTYWLPWYNNVDLNTQLRLANVSGSSATVRVYIGGVEMPGSPFGVAAGASTRLSFSGINNGPVKILSDQKIIAAERVLYQVNGVYTSFSETMGLPNAQLDMTYWLPWYNNVDVDTQLRFGNVSNSTATVHVYIGGAEMPGSPFTLAPGASTRKSFAGINSGPVKIVSNVNIVTAERVIQRAGGTPTSFSEMMALPNSQLDTSYWLPWYNNVDLLSELRFALP